MHFHVNGTAQDLYLNSDLFMLTRGHENACTLLILGQLRTCKTFWFFGGTITHYPVHCSDQVYLQSSALWFMTQCQCCPMWFLCHHQPKSFVCLTFDFRVGLDNKNTLFKLNLNPSSWSVPLSVYHLPTASDWPPTPTVSAWLFPPFHTLPVLFF